MDNRDLVADATLFLPVEVPGALFSVGDGHVAQIAYCLISCAGNLQITELVNAPNWTIVCSVPESCFI